MQVQTAESRRVRRGQALAAMADAGSSSSDGDGAAAADTLTTARDLIAQLRALASSVAADDARAISLLLTEARECFVSAPEATFCLSAKVVIQGLHSRPELNGQSAVINGLSSNSTGRFSLVTAAGEVLKIKPSNLVLAPTHQHLAPAQSQATTVEPMHSVDGLPAGWTCAMHTTANGRAYKKYTGPKGERASSLKQAWSRHEGVPGAPGPPGPPGPPLAPPPGTKQKRPAAAAPEEGLPPPPSPSPSAAAAAAAPRPPAHERVRLALRGVEGAASQLRLLPPSLLAGIAHEARQSWATLMGDAAPEEDGDGNTLGLALS